MRTAVRAIGVTLMALVGLVSLAVMSTVASVASAAATSVLIMGGSGDPLTTEKDGIPFVRQYTTKVVDNFVAPSSMRPGLGIPVGPYNAVAVITPAQFNTGDPADHSMTFDHSVAEGTKDLDTCISSATQCEYNEDIGSDAPGADDSLVVFGYSQSATIASFEKAALADRYPPGEGPQVSFILTANGNRPNGGFLARGPKGLSIPLPLPGGGVTFSGPTRTDTQYATVDIAIQYDGWADQPVNPFNLIAVANANAGQRLLHPHYADQSLDGPGIIDQGQYGDTRYLMVATDTLPLLHDVANMPGIGRFLADVLDAPLRVLVESGYDRTTSPGKPTTWSLFPAKNPLKTAVDFVVAIPTGWDNAIENINGTRPFGTQRPGPYGVGGPSVDYLNPSDETSEPAEAGTESATPTTLVARKTRSAPVDADAKLVAATSDTEVPSSQPQKLKSSVDSLPAQTVTDPSDLAATKLSTPTESLDPEAVATKQPAVTDEHETLETDANETQAKKPAGETDAPTKTTSDEAGAKPASDEAGAKPASRKADPATKDSVTSRTEDQDAQAKSKADTPSKNDASSKTEAKPKTEAKSKTEPKSKTEARSKTEPKSKTKAKSKTEAKSKTDAKTSRQAKSATGAKTATGPKHSSTKRGDRDAE
ncbi:PE-PPE domain-containing protein [Mycobacterium sp. GA-1841]|uniref:PE-PPE domain-containing protein n=1 Tax=Mycobacterium sp. GA-1841 TaxID=1834154 RepID=UPI00096E77C3|nr:PE-PPE domain-containing protein [Mycobacterium sp. GA-1841]OMC35548.1 PE-PPE domain-containing protein [Mycobacterium sp. GA-1841]